MVNLKSIPTPLLLLTLTIQSTTATPTPIWDRIINAIYPSVLTPSQSSPASPNAQQAPLANDARPGTVITSVFLPTPTVSTVHAETATPLPFPPAWDISYPEDRDEEAEDSSDLAKRQCTNSGLGNEGCNNSGNYNEGDNNSGNFNCGNSNSGNYNVGDNNSGNYNNGDGHSGNGGNAPGSCGNVVISQSQAWVYPAPSTVVVQVAPVTSIVVVQYPHVVTSYVVYNAPPATTIIYQPPQVVPVVAAETYAPRGCAYWEALGYRCSAGNGWREMRSLLGVWAAVLAGFWGVVLVVM